MSGVNKVILVGNLGRDPESREVGDSTVCNFSIATTRAYKKKDGEKVEETEWHRIAVWGPQAKACAQYLTKGRQVYVEGRLQTRKYEDKEGVTKYATDIVAETVQFLGGKGSREPGDDTGHEWGDTPKADAGGSDF